MDSLGNLAVKQELASCDIDSLHQLEDDFTIFLLQDKANEIFTLELLNDFD